MTTFYVGKSSEYFFYEKMKYQIVEFVAYVSLVIPKTGDDSILKELER